MKFLIRMCAILLARGIPSPTPFPCTPQPNSILISVSSTHPSHSFRRRLIPRLHLMISPNSLLITRRHRAAPARASLPTSTPGPILRRLLRRRSRRSISLIPANPRSGFPRASLWLWVIGRRHNDVGNARLGIRHVFVGVLGKFGDDVPGVEKAWEVAEHAEENVD